MIEISPETEIELASLRIVNESAIHTHALACSKKFRAGRFERVGKEFIDEVRTDVECLVRQMRAQNRTVMHEPLEPDANLCFTTGVLCDKVMLAMNGIIARIIQNKVQRQPSVGKTLGRTR